MLPIWTKSIVPVPAIWAITPVNSLVVAFPRILGPKMEATVEPMAKSHTRMIRTWYRPRYLTSLIRVPLKSRGFSPRSIAMGLPRPIGIIARPLPPVGSTGRGL